MEVHTYGTASEFEKKQIQKITTGLLRARILAVALNNVWRESNEAHPS